MFSISYLLILAHFWLDFDPTRAHRGANEDHGRSQLRGKELTVLEAYLPRWKSRLTLWKAVKHERALEQEACRRDFLRSKVILARLLICVKIWKTNMCANTIKQVRKEAVKFSRIRFVSNTIRYHYVKHYDEDFLAYTNLPTDVKKCSLYPLLCVGLWSCLCSAGSLFPQNSEILLSTTFWITSRFDENGSWPRD